MNYLRCMLAAILVCATAIYADNQESVFENRIHERDFEALRDYLRTKEQVDIKKKSDDLSISGDVRFEWQHITETQDDIRLRGPGVHGLFDLPISMNDFDVEFNLKFDYAVGRGWASAHLQFDNGAGIGTLDSLCFENPEGCHGSGDKNKLNLKRAYFGYNVWECGTERFDIEIGRRKLYDIFDSVIQFDSRFDGIVLEYTADKTPIGDFYWYLGGFVVDERVNHFAYVTEAGLLNIGGSGIYAKYSFIDWASGNDRNRCWVRHGRGWQYRNSQVTIGYFPDPKVFGRPVEFYGAFLVNHAARDITLKEFEFIDDEPVVVDTKHVGKQNIGWYVGVLVGKVKKEGDWSFEVDYEVVQAQAISDCDVAGIGRGNILNEFFTEEGIYRGNTNYKGISFDFLYAITDEFNIFANAKFSTAYDAEIGGSHRYSVYEIEAIYAF